VPALIAPGMFASEYVVQVTLPDGPHRTMWLDKSWVRGVPREPTTDEYVSARVEVRLLISPNYPSNLQYLWIELPAECIEGGQRCRVPREWVTDDRSGIGKSAV